MIPIQDACDTKNISALLRRILAPAVQKSEGKKYFRDKCRKKDVTAAPEEYVRQTVVNYFRWILRTPLRYMQTEVSMKHYGYTDRNDRADILILRPDGETILAVAECKAAHVRIGEEVTAQMLRYAEALNAEYAFATNGSVLITYGFDKKKGYVPVKCPGSYRQMCRTFHNTEAQIKTFCERPDPKKLSNVKYVRKFYGRYIGRDTKEELLPFLANLCDGLRDIHTYLRPKEYTGFFLERDLGVRTLEIVVPGGALFRNHNYRVFAVKDKEGGRFKIGMSIAVYSGAKSESTMLAVAVDDGSRCHHALQLILDTNAAVTTDEKGICCELTHNGKITIGRKGSARIREVLAYVKSEMPSLADRNDRIYLGKFHRSEQILVTSPEFQKVFDHLVSYVLLLEKFREAKLGGR